jgi:geranylgeranyl reductase family protein
MWDDTRSFSSTRTMTFSADVIVAGAGPAGAVAARTLAQAGLSTLLVDRAAFPRNKPCGGGISTRALTRFPWLEPALTGIDVHRIRRLHLEGPEGAQLDLSTDDPTVLLIRRVEFDDALVRTARAAGAQLESGFEITQVDSQPDGVTLQSRDGRRLSAPFVVAADGVHSVIAKRTGVNARWPRTHLAIDMMEETPVATLRAARPDVLWVAYAYNRLDGYAYVFPKTQHVNVGIGCLLSHFDREVDAAPYDLQEQFVASLTKRGVLHGQSDRQCFTPFLIPVGGPLPCAWHDRILFTGDAGGFVNAITAEGIYYAMASGELAGRAIADARGRALPAMAGRVYEDAWRGEFGAELADAVLIQRHAFTSHSRVREAIGLLSSTPAVTKPILEYFQGRMAYRALRRRLLLRFPLTLWRMARQHRAAAAL